MEFCINNHGSVQSRSNPITTSIYISYNHEWYSDIQLLRNGITYIQSILIVQMYVYTQQHQICGNGSLPVVRD